MPPERETWSRDACTCGHPDLSHSNGGQGRCEDCDKDGYYGEGTVCTRYQWNGKPRVRTW